MAKFSKFDNIADFYSKASKLDLGEKILAFKKAGAEFAVDNGLTLNKSLMKKNKGRTIFSDVKGNNYSLDTQHGAFEVTNKRGKHLGEMDFSGKLDVGKLDKSGGHDLLVK